MELITSVLEKEKKRIMKSDVLNVEYKAGNMIKSLMAHSIFSNLMKMFKESGDTDFNINADKTLNYNKATQYNIHKWIRYALIFNGNLFHDKVSSINSRTMKLLDDMADKYYKDKDEVEELQHMRCNLSLAEYTNERWARSLGKTISAVEKLELNSIEIEIDILHRDFNIINDLCIASIVVEGNDGEYAEENETKYYRVGLYAFGVEETDKILKNGKDELDNILSNIIKSSDEFNQTNYCWVSENKLRLIDRNYGIMDIL